MTECDFIFEERVVFVCFLMLLHRDGQTSSTQTDSSVCQSDWTEQLRAAEISKVLTPELRPSQTSSSSSSSHGGRPDIDQGRHYSHRLSFHSGQEDDTQGRQPAAGGVQTQPGPRTPRCGASLHLPGREDGAEQWGLHVWNTRHRLGANLQGGGWIFLLVVVVAVL